MTREEVRALLHLAAAFDGRSVDNEAVGAWYGILRPLRNDQAVQAVQNHFSTSDRRLMPFHVVDGVKKIRSELMTDFQACGQSLEIPDADPDDAGAYLLAVKEQRTRHGDGLHQVPVRKMIESLGDKMASVGAPVREATPKVVPCPKCQAVIGRECRTSTHRSRAPHDERVADFEEWKRSRNT